MRFLTYTARIFFFLFIFSVNFVSDIQNLGAAKETLHNYTLRLTSSENFWGKFGIKLGILKMNCQAKIIKGDYVVSDVYCKKWSILKFSILTSYDGEKNGHIYTMEKGGIKTWQKIDAGLNSWNLDFKINPVDENSLNKQNEYAILWQKQTQKEEVFTKKWGSRGPHPFKTFGYFINKLIGSSMSDFAAMDEDVCVPLISRSENPAKLKIYIVKGVFKPQNTGNPDLTARFNIVKFNLNKSEISPQKLESLCDANSEKIDGKYRLALFLKLDGDGRLSFAGADYDKWDDQDRAWIRRVELRLK